MKESNAMTETTEMLPGTLLLSLVPGFEGLTAEVVDTDGHALLVAMKHKGSDLKLWAHARHFSPMGEPEVQS